jgi:hypothetical protein
MHALVHVLLAVFQHPVDQSGQFVGHGRDGFRRSQLGALFYRGSLPGISGAAAVAGWFSLPALRRAEGLAGAWAAAAVCGYQSSVMAGTIFQDTRKPLTVWFRAVTSQKNGASAIGLQRALGLGSYDTAWTWLHKLRRAMVRPGRDRLSGRVEVDETYWGSGEERLSPRWRWFPQKVLIFRFSLIALKNSSERVIKCTPTGR